MPDALIVDNEPFLASKAPDIAAAGLPAISGGREFAVAAARRRTGSYIDRILKGAQPADLPIEQPTTFKLIINPKTARALGLTIPPSIRAGSVPAGLIARYSGSCSRGRTPRDFTSTVAPISSSVHSTRSEREVGT